MRNDQNINSWLNTAVSGIRFSPDREEVKAELLEHIEDKTIDLMRIFPDMEEKEAQERALAGMGDPEELKVSLAKVHTPWLGYLWTATRLLVWTISVIGLLIVNVYVLDQIQRGDITWWLSSRQYAAERRAVSRALYEDGEPDWEGERLSVFTPDVQLRLGEAEIAVPKAAWWRENEKDRLYLQVRVTWDRPWETNSQIFFSLWAEDDLGNRYLQEENTVPSRVVLQVDGSWCTAFLSEGDSWITVGEVSRFTATPINLKEYRATLDHVLPKEGLVVVLLPAKNEQDGAIAALWGAPEEAVDAVLELDLVGIEDPWHMHTAPGQETFTAQGERREDGWFLFQFIPHDDHREGQSCAMEMLLSLGTLYSTTEQLEQPYRLTLTDAQGNVVAEQSGTTPPAQILWQYWW